MMSEIEIQKWLIAKVANLAELDPKKIDVDEPFSVYGLSSSTGISMTADIEDVYKIRVLPTVIWDYPTISALAKFLATQVTQK